MKILSCELRNFWVKKKKFGDKKIFRSKKFFFGFISMHIFHA